MTVKELINELKKFPQDYDVVRDDMEYGPFYIESVKICQNKNYPMSVILSEE